MFKSKVNYKVVGRFISYIKGNKVIKYGMEMLVYYLPDSQVIFHCFRSLIQAQKQDTGISKKLRQKTRHSVEGYGGPHTRQQAHIAGWASSRSIKSNRRRPNREFSSSGRTDLRFDFCGACKRAGNKKVISSGGS